MPQPGGTVEAGTRQQQSGAKEATWKWVLAQPVVEMLPGIIS